MQQYDFLKGFVVGIITMFVLCFITISLNVNKNDPTIKCNCYKITQEK